MVDPAPTLSMRKGDSALTPRSIALYVSDEKITFERWKKKYVTLIFAMKESDGVWLLGADINRMDETGI